MTNRGPGTARSTDGQVEQVVTQTLESTPRGATHWSTRDLAKRPRPESNDHQSDLACLRVATASDRDVQTVARSVADRESARHRRAVSEPARHAAVFCVDEKPQIQALDRTQPLLPMRPGQVERRTHDYERHGTTSLFAALERKPACHRAVAPPSSFPGIPRISRPHRGEGAHRLDVHIVMDNYGTHKTAIIRNWFAKRPRFHVHFTPTYAFLAESRRTLVRRDNHQAHSAVASFAA